MEKTHLSKGIASENFWFLRSWNGYAWFTTKTFSVRRHLPKAQAPQQTRKPTSR
jgi:hypothetical protein